MSVHKVPQNVEAEDKLLGPFTFKQFIFLMATAFTVLLAWALAQITPWLIIAVLPFTLVFGVLGFYRREDQPVETYLLAAINYFIKPKTRTWNSAGLVENIKLLAPPPKQAFRTKSLESDKGSLEKLAHVMDTRGWALKRPELNEAPKVEDVSDDDRLVAPQTLAQEPIDIHRSDDVLDPVHYAEADKFTQLAETSVTNARTAAIAKMKAAAKEQPSPVASSEPKTLAKPTPAEAEIKTPQVAQILQKLSQDNRLPISSLAKHAQKLADGARVITEGQEIDLHKA